MYRLSWNFPGVQTMNLTSYAYYQDPFNLIGLQLNLIFLNGHFPVVAIYLAIVRQSRWVAVVVGNGNQGFFG